jgi:hypothetical protein
VDTPAPVRPVSMVLLWTAAVLLTTACLPGARDEPPAEEGASAPDACQVLTREDVQSVQGGTTEAGVDVTGLPPRHRGCVYGQEDSGTVTTITLFPGDADRFRGEREAVELNFEAETLDGLGDEAFLGGGVLHVRQGGLIMTLFAGGPATEAEAKDKLLRLAPKALARM